MYINDMGYIQH